MTRATTTAKGVIHGRTISLDQAPNLPDGQQVTVTMQPLLDALPREPGEGIRRSAGAWVDDADGLEDYLEWTRQQRKQVRRDLEP
jgi:hypothetical protein